VLLNVPEGMTATAVTEALRIIVRGRENRLQDLTEENITVYIDFTEGMPGPNYYSCTIEIQGVEDVGVVYGDNDYRVLVILSTIKPGTGL
jgi:hypothetical protein